jgi:hypothetical protein
MKNFALGWDGGIFLYSWFLERFWLGTHNHQTWSRLCGDEDHHILDSTREKHELLSCIQTLTHPLRKFVDEAISFRVRRYYLQLELSRNVSKVRQLRITSFPQFRHLQLPCVRSSQISSSNPHAEFNPISWITISYGLPAVVSWSFSWLPYDASPPPPSLLIPLRPLLVWKIS